MFQSHYNFLTQQLHSLTVNATWDSYLWSVRAAAIAVGNGRLAASTDTEDADDMIRSVCDGNASDLAVWLVCNEACHEGCGVVGPNIDYETLDLVLAHRPDYREWYDDALESDDAGCGCGPLECDCDYE